MNLQKFFEIYDISISELARIAGICRPVMSQIKNNKSKKITAETAIRIQLATENVVKIADLVGERHIKSISSEIEKRLDNFKKET